MLLTALLLACSAEAPPAAPPDGRGRQHHADTPTNPAEEGGDAAEGDATPGGGNRAPIVRRLTVGPTKPSKLSTLSVKVNATDPEGQELRYAYHWMVNGSEVFGHDSPDLELAEYARGDTVEVKVVVSDGQAEVSGQSDPITVGNADPQFPHVPGPDDPFDGLHLTAVDPDGDDVTWRLEGAPPGASVDKQGYLHFTGSKEDKGGNYTVKVIAEDGQGGKGTIELPLTVSAGSAGKAPPAGVPTGGR
jgi:hypothetical protein